VEAGVDTRELAASPDIYRTLLKVAGAERPERPLDGHDLMPFLTGAAEESPRERYYYFLNGTLEAMREGRWKLRVAGDTTQLFDLQGDPAERFNRAAGHPERVEAMRARMEAFADSVGATLPEE
jgi:arylsulfatase A-like enzyme